MKRLNKTKEELRINDMYQAEKAKSEMIVAFDKMNDLPPCVSIFGSARLKEDSEHYKLAVEIASKLGENGYGIVTGGGLGIMEAANKGAKKVGTKSVGIGIELPFEASNNDYIDSKLNIQLDYFHVRKVVLCKYSQAFVCMAGGVGTLDELFEVITLQQTQKTEPYPIILVGSSFWKGLIDWMKNQMLEIGTINEKDLDRFRIVDTADEVVEKVNGFMNKYRKGFKVNFN